LQDSQGRLWVNDTKATNENAVMAALNRYKNKKIHLIVGGDDKDVYVAGIMEHIEEAGIHSGDSACSLPPCNIDEKMQEQIVQK
ncbi:cyanophycin synthetase, partial [Campylobacter coli]